MQEIETLEQMEKYIRGNLTRDEINNLWIEFLRDPELFEYFQTLVGVHKLARK